MRLSLTVVRDWWVALVRRRWLACLGLGLGLGLELGQGQGQGQGQGPKASPNSNPSATPTPHLGRPRAVPHPGTPSALLGSPNRGSIRVRSGVGLALGRRVLGFGLVEGVRCLD